MTAEQRRPYDSSRRREDAAGTRAAILDAALELFSTKGYATVTVAEIAAHAGVSLRTVYSSAGGKPELLAAVIARAESSSGGEEVIDRVKELNNPSAVLAALAKGTREGNERSQAIFELARSTASMPEALEIRASLIRRYAELLDVAAGHLMDIDALIPSMTSREAGEILWFCFGVDAWTTTTRDLRKSWAEAERWLLRRAQSMLLR
ncbi:transcriptional regulator, TetR family [Rathayibacter oskolensis]|uniref:Transcriptional regulator, TetR family n=1 Tax=Rathayibacter oskolensis TaxID=1891671 RepID=A0A1X7P0I5_9MICO|nr:TetR/AcrR family transcriptional regulator [Rathayibacter oskolensis]SMH44061.1 transcriptional regulator, TetR family [Rathayibacter oskolensis]